MARQSQEAKAAALWRVAAKPPATPKGLSPEARAHWRRIVGARPADFFTEGNLQLLATYCRTLVQLERATAALEAVNPVNRPSTYADHVKVVSKLGNLTIALATKLRLTIQSALRGEAGKNAERAPQRSPLIGGNITAIRRA